MRPRPAALAALLSLIALCALPACGGAPAPRARSAAPNLLIIVADDLGYGDLGCYGSPDALTPRLDALAAQGQRLTDFYVASPMCSPSRASLLTGRSPARHGLGQALTSASEVGLAASEVLLPERLAARGYRTGLVGKWHLGHEPGGRPTERGFDEFFGMLRGSSGYTRHSWRGEPDLWRDTEAVTAEGRHATELFTEEALGFVERNQERAWFLMLSYSAPHLSDERGSPISPPEHEALFDATQLGAERAAYLAAVSTLDEGVGRLLAGLDELQLSEDTLIVFLSDNGALPPWGSNAPFAGVKDTLDEGGLRVPCLVRWPARLSGGIELGEPLVATDWMPTLLAAAGASLPAGRTLDGVDILPVLEHGAAAPRDGIAFEHRSRRLGPDGMARHDRALRSGSWRLDLDHRGKPRLFDLAVDPSQRNDLSALEPERVAELRGRLEALTGER